MAAVSSGEVTWNRRSVLALMKHSEHDPERFATNLVQASSAQESADCSALTGYEHCQACAMPAVTQLVTELVNVRRRAWYIGGAQGTRRPSPPSLPSAPSLPRAPARRRSFFHAPLP
jgi:hypothetical protein